MTRLLEVSMRLTRRHSGCDDGTCPAIYDTDDPALLAVQGATLVDPDARVDLGAIPAHEAVVVLPRALLESYLRSGHD